MSSVLSAIASATAEASAKEDITLGTASPPIKRVKAQAARVFAPACLAKRSGGRSPEGEGGRYPRTEGRLGLLRHQPFHGILERSECTDSEAFVLGAEREERCVIKPVKWTKNGRLSGKGLAKTDEFGGQIPKVGCRHCGLRHPSVQEYFVVARRG